MDTVSVGAAFTGNTKLRTFLIFEGEPSSGKSLFLEVFAELGRRSDERVSGSSYVIGNASPDAIIQKRNGSNFAKSQFGNNRIVGVSEPNSREELDGDFIKAYTGDHTVSTEKKHQDFHSDIAQGLLIIATNEMPRMNSIDAAIMNRAKIVKFPKSFVENPVLDHEDKAIEGLRELLIQDRSAVLHWVIEGMYLHKEKYNRLEHSAPAIMNEWAREHKNKIQTPKQWAEDLISEGLIEYVSNPDALSVHDKKEFLEISKGWQHFELWTKLNGYPNFKRNAFMKVLTDEYGIHTPDEDRMKIKSGSWRFKVFLTTPAFETSLSDLKMNA